LTSPTSSCCSPATEPSSTAASRSPSSSTRCRPHTGRADRRPSDALVTACLLHDLGHLLNEQGETPTLRGIDDTHQYFALPFLRGLLPDAVLMRSSCTSTPSATCARPSGYYARLSEDSKRSLALQGGAFDAEQAAGFIDQPGARDAVLLRQWDDLAKQPHLATPPLAHFLDARGVRAACRRDAARMTGRSCSRCCSAPCCTRRGTRSSSRAATRRSTPR
jgi:predicted HD phosphohydrolase